MGVFEDGLWDGGWSKGCEIGAEISFYLFQNFAPKISEKGAYYAPFPARIVSSPFHGTVAGPSRSVYTIILVVVQDGEELHHLERNRMKYLK